MGKNSAEYMRAYRLRKKAARVIDLTTIPGRIDASFQIVRADSRIAELEEEVRHLKAELASRSAAVITLGDTTRDVGALVTRKAQQANRDAILRKINRGG
jgi:hypothetical protein